MRNTLLAIALTTTGFLAIPALGQAADTSGFFINGNIGQASLDKGAFDDDDTAFGANIGYRWAVAPAVLIGIEGGYTDLGSFKAKLSTSAPLRAHIKADCLKRWPGRLIEIYGLTEGGGSCTLEANLHPDKLHTVGKPGLGSEIVVLDEQGKVLPQGEVGELAGRAQAMMKGYYKQSDKTRDLFWHDEEGRLFFKSGDMGRIDEDGFVVLLDRKKDMIISGGFNVYAADIEVLLLRHPDVIDVAVIGIPSEQWGESPMALCVRRPGAAATEAGIRDWANGQLSKTQRLVGVEFRESLPRSTIGKIMKRELREPYWAGRSAKI